MNNSKKAKNHLQISSDSLPEIALLPGDPARVYEIGECLSNVKETRKQQRLHNYNRNL
ncbi:MULTISPECIES: hypothetical protein [unclassified Mesotoga]|uniref:hypothetical protein n=1 Tax=unclassified Mesotoga TaxID=1184398 RepID=UPI0021ACAE8F|nr:MULTISPECIES: hypothetical protein [unclassified Mesotoga]